MTGEELLAEPIVIGNAGTTPIQAVVTTVAAPAQPLPAGGDGFTISRAYYRMDGSEANVTEVTQNERFVVVLRVTESSDWASRVLVNDLLPAGFEIDNPRLVSSADLANFGWLQRTDAAHLEFRDDRFIAAFDREQRQRPQHHARLCGARGDAGRLRASGRRRRGHVPAAIFGPHLDRHDGGQGAVTEISSFSPFTGRRCRQADEGQRHASQQMACRSQRDRGRLAGRLRRPRLDCVRIRRPRLPAAAAGEARRLLEVTDRDGQLLARLRDTGRALATASHARPGRPAIREDAGRL